MPSTVIKENFAVRGKNVNSDSAIKDIMYFPAKKTALLMLEPMSVCDFSYVIEASDEVLEISGEKTDKKNQNSDLKIGFDAGQEGISVLDLAIYDGENRILKPVGKMSVMMEIELLNTTLKEQKGEILVYQEGNEEKPLISSQVTLNAAGTAKFVFAVLETEFFEEKELNIVLRQ